MRQVDYTGFGWEKVHITLNNMTTPSHTSSYQIKFALSKEIVAWLRNYNSGGYYSIQYAREKTESHEDITVIYPESISFSRKNDAMMFMWQCL